MNQNKLIELLGLFVDGGISREEYDLLFDYIRANSEDEELNIAIDTVFKNSKKFNPLNSDDKEVLLQSIIRNKHFVSEIQNELETIPAFAPRLWYQLGVAASILLLIVTSLFFYTNRTPVNKLALKVVEPKKAAVILPGDNKAILTLSDGTNSC